jgi:hypothetical protein
MGLMDDIGKAEGVAALVAVAVIGWLVYKATQAASSGVRAVSQAAQNAYQTVSQAAQQAGAAVQNQAANTNVFGVTDPSTACNGGPCADDPLASTVKGWYNDLTSNDTGASP